MPHPVDREAIADVANPLGLDGIEFVEYATSTAAGARPGARDDGLPAGRAAPLARGAAVPAGRDERRHQRARQRAGRAAPPPSETPEIAAIALRVRDAAAAYQRALDRGAWAVPTHVEVMELNIPGDPRRRRAAASTSSTATASSRSTTSTSCRSPPSTPHAAGARRPALVRHRAVHRHRPHGGLDRVLPRAVRLRRAARRPALRHPAQGRASCAARAAASTCS